MSFESNLNNFNFSMPSFNSLSGMKFSQDMDYGLFGFSAVPYNDLTRYVYPSTCVDTFDFSSLNINNSFNNYMNQINNKFADVDWAKLWNDSIDMYKKQIMAFASFQNTPVKGDNASYISKLSPVMQQKTKQLLSFAKEKGLNVNITSGYRTEAEQARLYATNPNAAKNSLHTKGMAIDISIQNGSDSDYKLLGDYAKSIGMRWGGDFKSPRAERWHFDLG